MQDAPVTDHPDNEATQLLRRYVETGDRALRDRAIALMAPLAKRLARRIAHGRRDDDLDQVALLGLTLAADRFDPRYPRGFVAYAVPTILGELKRHLRDQTWAMRISRSVKENSLNVLAATDRLRTSRGEPTIDEVAAETGLTAEDVLEAFEVAGTRRLRSLDALAGPSDYSIADVLGDCDPAMEGVVDLVAVRQAMATLDEGERHLLDLRFGRQMAQAAIGAEIGVSQMQVSRLLRRALATVRQELLREDEPARVPG